MSNELAQRNMSLSTFMDQTANMEGLIKRIGRGEAGPFKAALISAVQSNPKLAACTPASLVSCGLSFHALKLPPSQQLGYGYFVPYKNRKQECTEAQFQIGYKGYIQLAMRTGQYKKLTVTDVKEGEFVSWNPLTEDMVANFIEDPIARIKAKTVGYCGYFEYLNGFRKMIYWTVDAVKAHADKYSPAFNLADLARLESGKVPQKDLWKFSSFWYKDFDLMALKTVIRQLLTRWGFLSAEMQEVAARDAKEDYGSFADAQMDASEDTHAGAGSKAVEATFEEPSPMKWLCNECSSEFKQRKEGKCPSCGSEDLTDQKPAGKKTAPKEDAEKNESGLNARFMDQ